MRQVDQVLEQIRARYRNNWRDWTLQGSASPLSFPLSAPSAQVIARESDGVGQWMRAWRDWSEAHPGVRMRSATRRTIIGSQAVFTHLEFSTIDDLVAADESLAEHWLRARTRMAQLRTLPGGITDKQLRPYLQQIVELDATDFQILLDAARWFTTNPRSGLTIRQVPIAGMHTKWLARHRRLVLACLEIAQPDIDAEAADDGLDQNDLDPLGLRALPVLVDVILTDPADRALVGGVRHLTAPLPEIDALPIRPATVLIIENKESAYLIPDLSETVVVHSLGNHLNVLDTIGWIAGARHLYWGDIDRAGYTLLSRARTRLPQLLSVLMDQATLEEHRVLAVGDETRADTPDPNLTDSESAALSALSTGPGIYVRLEQERLPAHFVLDRLSHVGAIASNRPDGRG